MPSLQRMRLYRFLRQKAYQAIRWVSERILDRNYEILVSVIIGIVAGLVAVLLKFLVVTVKEWLHGSDPGSGRLIFVFLPVIGIALTLIYQQFILRRPVQSGLSGLIFAISKKKVNLPPFESYAHVIGSSLTVGFGGSVGLEAPIIRTGSAIGSNLARILLVGRKRQTLFLASGAAAGMAAIFNSPVAAVVFAFEVLLSDIALHSFIPLLISAATGAVVARLLYYEQLFFLPSRAWAPEALPYYFLLGILCGLLSAYMIRTVLKVDEWFKKVKHPLLRIGLGGLAIGALIFLMPPLFGEGYPTVKDLFGGRIAALVDHSPFHWFSENSVFLIVFGLVLVFAKAVASAITIAIGGNGGVFAPAMFTGAMFGFVFAHALNLLDWVDLYEPNFIAVAMAGLLSGVFKSPLTGIFLIAEITGGYALFVPLMIVSALAYFVTFYFEPHSVFTRELYQRGLWVPPYERDLSILQNLTLNGLVETNFLTVHPEMTLGDFVPVIARSRRNLFPVVDHDDHLKGIVLLDDVREFMFKTELYPQMRVRDMMHNPPATVEKNESMEKVMQKFERTDAWNLPIVHEGRYIGFVSKSSIFNKYRQSLIDRSKEV